MRKGDIPNSKSCFASNQKTIRSHLKSLDNKFKFFQQFEGSCPGNLSRLSGMHEDFRKIWQLHPVSTYDFWLTRIQCYQLHFCCLVPGWVVACWLGWLVATIPMSSGDETSDFVFFPKNLTNISPWVTWCLEDDSWFTSFVERGPPFQVTFVHFAGKTRDCCGRVRDLRLGRHFRQIPKTASPWWFIFFFGGGDYTGTQLCGDDFVHKPLKIRIPQIPICSMYVFFYLDLAWIYGNRGKYPIHGASGIHNQYFHGLRIFGRFFPSNWQSQLPTFFEVLKSLGSTASWARGSYQLHEAKAKGAQISPTIGWTSQIGGHFLFVCWGSLYI